MTLTGGRRRHGLARPYNAASYLSTPTPDAITGGDTKDVARAAKRIADAAIDLARYVAP